MKLFYSVINKQKTFNYVKKLVKFGLLASLFILVIIILQFLRYFASTFVENEELRLMIHLDRSDTPVNESEKIPQIIHQIWQPHYMQEMPEEWRKGMLSWAKHNPGFIHMMWDDQTIEALIDDHYPWFMEFYKTYDYATQRFDAARFLIMYHYGGMYADMDIACPNNRVVGELMNDAYSVTLFRKYFYSIGTDIFMAKARSSYFKHVIASLYKSRRFYIFPHWNIVMATGPAFMYGAYMQYPFKSEILLHERIYANSRIVDLSSSSWHEWDTPVVNIIESYSWVIALVIIAIILWRYRIGISYVDRIRVMLQKYQD